MEHIAAVRELLEFIRVTHPSPHAVFHFLSNQTLKKFSVENLFFGVVRSNGSIRIPFSNSEAFNLLTEEAPTTYLDEHTPGYGAYTEGKIVEEGNFDEYPFYYPENRHSVFPNGFEYSVIFPVPGLGALLLFSDVAQKCDDSDKDFLYSIGEIFAAYIVGLKKEGQFDVEGPDVQAVTLLPLTPRQWAIKDAMLRGLTNGAIAREMNFSESLIRHETIRIYSKLGISGRKELFAREANFANLEEKREA